MHRVPRFMLAIGDSSYSLYLTHPFAIAASGKLWVTLGLQSSVPLIVLFTLGSALALIVGHLLYLGVERPLGSWLSRSWPSTAPLLHVQVQ